MKKVFIQYKVKPEQAHEVEALIKNVFDELRTTNPDHIGYSAQKLDDGQTFIHTYVAEADVKNPIIELLSFKKLQGFIQLHHIEKPVSKEMWDIDLYGSVR